MGLSRLDPRQAGRGSDLPRDHGRRLLQPRVGPACDYLQPPRQLHEGARGGPGNQALWGRDRGEEREALGLGCAVAGRPCFVRRPRRGCRRDSNLPAENGYRLDESLKRGRVGSRSVLGPSGSLSPCSNRLSVLPVSCFARKSSPDFFTSPSLALSVHRSELKVVSAAGGSVPRVYVPRFTRVRGLNLNRQSVERLVASG